jgi:hypothetical protein
VSRGTPHGVHIRSPGGATETVPGDLSPLRGLYNPGPLLDPTAYAMGYSLSALRASGSGKWVLRSAS